MAASAPAAAPAAGQQPHPAPAAGARSDPAAPADRRKKHRKGRVQLPGSPPRPTAAAAGAGPRGGWQGGAPPGVAAPALVPAPAAGGWEHSPEGRALLAQRRRAEGLRAQLGAPAAAAEEPPRPGPPRPRHEHREPAEAGQVCFPVMSPAELAPLTLPASAPPEQLRAVLERWGACLVTGVLGPADCAAMEQLWHSDLLQLADEERAREEDDPGVLAAYGGLRDGGPAQWPRDWDRELGWKFASQRGTPHGSFAWAARLHPGVRRVFADIFDTTPDQLAVGLDNTFWAAADAPAARANKEWLHCDQNHNTKMTWRAVQGVVYVWPSEGDSCSTTVVWPGSHLPEVYSQVMGDPHAKERGKSMGGQLVQLNRLLDPDRRERLLRAALSGARRMPCPAGSLLLWDSRTIHQGWAGGPRLAQPVCWEPRERRCERALRRKLWMCAAGAPSSHSSSEGRVHALAPKQRPRPIAPARSMPLRATLIPFGVAPGRELQWRALWDDLWAGGPHHDCRRNADQCDGDRIAAVLRSEVLGAL
eukprot:TRINITY_DN114_c0_g1_i1.p1 TRINITY_DN114_c0_g1~~TRINITY_DN114_c0_g1_i1.p1  ORF type:complete len:533 (+),score=160.93 TRINITY_DN114_c0_g1_i1:86-1684(+)